MDEHITSTRCSHCGDVIGAYEPTVTVSDGFARRISRASAPDALATADACYHDACYEQLHNEPARDS